MTKKGDKLKAPKIFTGWITSDRKAHDTQNEAQEAALRDALIDLFYKRARLGQPYAYFSPEAATDALLEQFHVTPKKLESW